MRTSRILFVNLIVLACGILLLPGCIFAQSLPQGIPWYTIPIPVPGGFVDAMTGNVHLEFPMAAIPQRNGDPLVMKALFDSTLWFYNGGFGPQGPGWRLFTGNTRTGMVHTYPSSQSCTSAGYSPYTQGQVSTWNFVYEDYHSTGHSPDSTYFTKRVDCYWPSAGQYYGSADDVASLSVLAYDGSGYRFVVSNYNNLSVFAPDGAPVGFDPNGNRMGPGTCDSLGTLADTLGRCPFTFPQNFGYYLCGGFSPPTSSIGVHASDGSTSTYTISCASYPVSEIVSGVQYTTQENFMTGIGLPDGTQYTFAYDTGSTGMHLGGLTSITLPGGGVVLFTYTTLNGGSNFPGLLGSVQFGGGTWNLSYLWNTSTRQTVTTALSPFRFDSTSNGNVQDTTVFTTVPNFPYVQTAQYYSGSSTLLRTVSTAYDAVYKPTTVTTTLNDSGQSSSVSYQYFQNMRNYPTQIQETDFTGTVVRTKSIAYNPSFMKPTSVNVYAGSGTGSPVSSTLYGYDEYSANYCKNGVPMLTNVTGATGHDDTNYGSSYTTRGNPTTVQRLISGASYSSTHVCYDTLGNVTQAVDANGNPTSFDYSDSGKWADSHCISSGTNTHAFPTTVTDALGHQTKFTYLTCTSLKQSEKDQNDLNNGRAGTVYAYDGMQRVVSVPYPDGGSTTTSYNDAPPSPTVTTSSSVTPSQAVTTTATMDGLGRTVKTALTTDPDGATYSAVTYDAFGRPYQQYNPTRCNPPTSNCSESTWGYTTSYYNALGLVTQVMEQDGSKVNSTYSGPCTTVTDEAANARKSCTDALGRLVEVDEPGPASAATSATGSVTVSGSEQTTGGAASAPGTGSVAFTGALQNKQVQTQAATPGGGSLNVTGSERSTIVGAAPGTSTVTITGSERSQTVDPCQGHSSCPFTSYDTGYVSVTVNGFASTYYYGSPDTPASVALGLAAGFNGSGSSPVTATVNGSTFTVRAKTNGTATNYSLSKSCNTTNSYFSGCSFYASGNNLTGGSNGTTSYDTGTVSLIVNGVTASASYGQGDTPATVASKIQSAAGSLPVNVTLSGSTLTLTAKTTGASTNYSLSSTCATTNGNFTGCSFSGTPSGSALTGGANAVYTTRYDSGTSTITVNGHADTVSWSGSSTTPSSIASSLASAINGDSSASVTATASSATVNLTAKTTGAATNYSLGSSGTYDTADFSSPSFTASNSGSTLTGGTNGSSLIYDSGNVWISVAGFQASAAYGQNSTPSTIAAALAGTLNSSSSSVSATASGATISLTTKAAGANTNYSLSLGSSTSQPGTFPGPSFTVSGAAALAGGTTPVLSLSTPVVTTYNYDVLDDLLTVVQGGSRPRTFTYDGMARLTSSLNPESGAISNTSYTYDANSNVIGKTAPAPNQNGAATVSTAYTYDALNRLTQKSFNDNSTPTVTYAYDGNSLSCSYAVPTLNWNNAANAIGKRTAMCDGAGSEAWTYPLTTNVGWSTVDARNNLGVTLTTTAQNNLAGSLYTLAYPTGNTLTYTPGGANRPVSLAGAGSAGNISYSPVAHYWPSGVLAQISNGPNLSSTFILDPRLQPCWVYATTGTPLPVTTACTGSFGTGNILDLKYSFNLGTADNGNVAAITNNRDNNRSQAFAYDQLNRLTNAQTASSFSVPPSSPSRCWGETFAYDVWGNLLSRSLSSSNYGGCAEESFFSFTMSAQNQIQNPTNPPPPQCFNNGALATTALYCYDAPGNLMADTTGASHYYDAEGHLKSLPTLSLSYAYDGGGKRVAKVGSSGPVKLYWYGTSADPLDETDGTGATNNSAFNEYAFFGGKRLARRDYQNNVNYYVADHLGTARAIVQAGQTTACYDADFYPFGGERIYTDTCDSAYKFTGKERDPESGLDNFGARYDSSWLGRFMSPDWSEGPEAVPYARFDDPQSLNLYAYVGNNPATGIDDDGHDPEGGPSCTYIYLIPCLPIDRSGLDFSGLREMAERANDAAHQAYDWLKASRRPGCVGAYTAAGAVSGAAAGGLVGLAGGPTAVVTVPGGATIGLAGGGVIGWVAGMNACMQGSGSSGGSGGGGGSKWKLGSNKSLSKWANQMRERGWTEAQIDEAINHGKQFPAANNINPANGATRFINPTTGQSLVMDNVTGEVIHVGGPGFKY